MNRSPIRNRRRSSPSRWREDVRQAVRARSGGNCEVNVPGVCLGAATNLHHRLPRRMGGSRNPALGLACNALAVCGEGNVSGCHGWLETHRVGAVANGWLLHAGASPESTAARVRGRFVFLTASGTYSEEAAA